MTDPRDPHCRYPKCECPAGQDSDFATDIGRDNAALIELGRRHPAAANDVDAILAMRRSDAVDEGLLADEILHAFANALHGPGARVSGKGKLQITIWAGQSEWANIDLYDALVAALRAVPSPDAVGVREALEAVRGDVVTAIAFLNRDAGTDRIHPTARNIANQLAEADKRILAVRAALSPSHCTAGRREEIDDLRSDYLRRHKDACDRWAALTEICQLTNVGRGDILSLQDALHEIHHVATAALTSEQSGPTAGRDCPGCNQPFPCKCVSYASPPDRQQDQDETSVLPRGASAEPVAWRYRRGDIPEMDWRYSSEDMSPDYECEPLYASPPVSDASREALRPFASFGLTEDGKDIRDGLMRDRICDWFGPSDFDAARNSFDKTGGGE